MVEHARLSRTPERLTGRKVPSLAIPHEANARVLTPILKMRTPALRRIQRAAEVAQLIEELNRGLVSLTTIPVFLKV